MLRSPPYENNKWQKHKHSSTPSRAEEALASSAQLNQESVAVVLAAGQSRRFGADKRIQPMADNRTLLVHTLDQYLAVFAEVLLVLRPSDEADNGVNVLAGLRPHASNLTLLYATDARLGMGHSLAFAAQHLISKYVLAETTQHAPQPVHSFIVALADMPFIKASTHRLMATTLRKLCGTGSTERSHQHPHQYNNSDWPIVQPRFAHRPGNPVGFHLGYAAQLAQAGGDMGARVLLRDNAHNIHYLDVDDAGVVRDVDQPSDLTSN